MATVNTRPGDKKADILHRIVDGYDSFSKMHRRIADLINEAPEECAMLTVTEFADRAGVAEATVLRFARALGYAGFPGLQNALRERLMQRVTLTSHRVADTLTHLGTTDSVLTEFVGRQARYLQSMLELIQPKIFDDVVRSVVEAGRVYVYGEGAAATPVHAMDFWLTRFGIDVRSITEGSVGAFDRIIHAGSGDVLVVFGGSAQRRTGTKLMDWMSRVGGTTVFVNDMPDEAAPPAAALVLPVNRGPRTEFHSTAVTVALADAITLAVAQRLGDKAIAAATLLDETREYYSLD